METRPSNARGPTVTTLVAGLGLFLLIVVFTLSTLCAAPSAGAGITPSAPPGIGTVHSETHQDPISPPLYPRAVEAPDHGSTDNSLAPSLRVISFSLAGLASSEPRFNGLPSSPSTETDRPSPFAPVALPVPALEDASLMSLTVLNAGTRAPLAPGFDPDVTLYGLTVNSDAVLVVAETTEAGARIVSTTIGDETTVHNPPGNRFSTGVSLAEDAVTRVSITVQAPDGVTTRTYHLDLSRPGPASPPGNATAFGFG